MPLALRSPRFFAAIGLVIAGISILVFGIPAIWTRTDRDFQIREVVTLLPQNPGFPRLKTRFPIARIEAISVAIGSGSPLRFDVAHYRDRLGASRQAIVYIGAESKAAPSTPAITDLNGLRSRAWIEVSQALEQSRPTEKLVLTWWDNAQRTHLFNAAIVPVDAPVREAFEDSQLEFWETIVGGFATDGAPSEQLASWLLSEAEQSIEAIQRTYGQSGEVFLLVSIDDLAHLSEMKTLSGKPAHFETHLFPTEENIHRLISQVKRWVQEKGSSNYLVEHLGNSGVRVWRITTPEAERTLLARLLPFTSSLAKPLDRVELLHRSSWSGYLSLYRLDAAKAASEKPISGRP